MGNNMTNQEAIKTVEDMVKSMNGIDVLYAYEQDALNQLIKTVKEYDELCIRIGGHGGYLMGAEDIHKVLEKGKNENRRRNSTTSCAI